ncbi:MAG: hypothetical protein AB8G99_04180, partial [Planctomycetaceae bacterium]
MQLLQWLLRFVRRLFWDTSQDDKIDPRAVELSVTRLEPRVVLNASALAAVFDVDAIEAESAADTIEIDAGDQADDGQADEFRLSTSGSRFHIDVNDQRVYSGDVDDSTSLTLRGSSDADQFTIDLSGGNQLPDGLRIEGGDSGATDSLIFSGGSVDTVGYEFAGSGTSVGVDGEQLTFEGIESVADLLSAHSRHFVYANSPDEITLASGESDGFSSLNEVTFDSDLEQLEIKTIGTGQTVIDVHSIDSNFDGDLDIDSSEMTSVVISGEMTTRGEVDIDAGSIQHVGSVSAGSVFLEADHYLTLSGTASVHGETIHVLGSDVRLIDNARVDASGVGGGGEILIGGDYLGSNPDIQNAVVTHVGENVVITADALETGDGGRVIVWSDTTTTAVGSGNISARGGSLEGDGGFIETSGKQRLQVGGAADASAANGVAGTWLLDPFNVTITNGGTETLSAGVLNPTSDDTEIDASTIATALNAGTSVVINTSGGGTQDGNIVVDEAITHTSGDAVSLTLNADNDITINDAISSTGAGTLSVVLNAVGDITAGATVATNGGDFSAVATGAGSTFTSSAHLQTGVGDVTVSSLGNVSLGQMTVGGDVILSSEGTITDSAALVIAGTTTITAGTVGTPTNVILNNNDFGGAVSVNRANDVLFDDTSGGIVLGASTISGDFDVTATGDITETGSLTVSGTSRFETANGESILLGTSTHTLTGTVVFDATSGTLDSVTIHDSTALNLSALTLSGSLAVTAAGITDSGTLDVSGTATLVSVGAGNDIVLDTTSNDFGSVDVTSGNDAMIDDTNLITIAGADVDGNLVVRSDEGIAESGTMVVDGDASYSTRNGFSILLGTSSHTFGGIVSFAAGSGTLLNVSVADSTALDLSALTLTGDLTVSAAGITDSGTLNIAGDTSLTSTGVGNDIVLDESGSDFNDLSVNSQDAVSIVDTDAVNLTVSSVGGNLTVEAGGSITDGGVLDVAGDSSFTAGSGNSIRLDDFTHTFTGALSFAASSGNLSDVEVNDSTSVELHGLTVADDLRVTSGGDITESGALVVSDIARFEVDDGGSVLLGTSSHTFSNTVTFVATSGTIANVAITDTTALNLSAIALTGDLTVTAAGITDSGTISVGGDATLTSTGASNNIVLNQTSNDFNRLNLTSANNAEVQDTTDVELTGVNVANALTIEADDDITESGALIVGGDSTFTVGNTDSILLGVSTHTLTGTVTFSSSGTLGSVAVVDSTALDLQGMTVGGALDVTAAGISDSGNLNVTGVTTLTSTGLGNDIALDQAGSNFGTVRLSSDRDASIDDTTSIVIGLSNVAGNLVVQSDDGISDDGLNAISVTGNSTFTTGSGDSILLGGTTHDFTGTVGFVASSGNLDDVSIDDSSDLELSPLAVDGNLTVVSGGTITESGALVVAGNSSFSVGDGESIDLDNNTHTFTGTIAFSSTGTLANVAVDDSTSIDLSGLVATGTLDIVSGGAITESGVLDVDGDASFTAAGGSSILLNTSTHLMTGSVSFAAGSGTLLSVAIDNASSIELGATSVTGDLTVLTGGSLTESGVLLVGGDASFTAADGASISLATNTHTFSGDVAFAPDSGRLANVSISDSTSLNLAPLSLSGNLTVTAAGVTDSGVLTIDGTASVTSTGGANDVVLDANNDFAKLSVTSGRHVTVNDANSIEIGPSSVGGNLTVTAVGDITECGAIGVIGDSSFTVGDGNSIDLDDNTHTLTGSVAFASTGTLVNVAVDDSTSINLTAMTVTGTLTILSGGDITESGALVVAGDASFTSSNTGTIDLDANTHTFSSGLVFAASSGTLANVAVTDSTAIDLAAMTLTGSLTVSAAGITDAGVLTVAGSTSLTSTGVANNIVLDEPSDFSSLSLTSANNASVVDSNDIQLTASSAVGDLTVSADGSITESGVLLVTGNSVFSAGDGSSIDLDNNTHTFSGTVAFQSGGTLNNVAVSDSTSLDLAALTLTGTLDVTSGGTITESGVLDIDGVASFTAAGGSSILLNTNTHTLNSNVAFAATSGTLVDVALDNSVSVDLGAMTLAGDLNVVSGGDITENGVLSITGASSFTAGAGRSIDLDTNSHTFTGAVDFASAGTLLNVAVDDTTSISLNGMTVSGTLDVVSGGSITETGVLEIGGNASFTAASGSSVLLNTSTHQFSGSVGLTASSGTLANVAIDNSTSIELGTTTVTNNLTVVSGGDISESGVLTVGGDSTFTAGTGGSINLHTNAHTLTSAVTFGAASGNLVNLAVNDSTAIDLAGQTLSGMLNVTAAGIRDSGVLSVAGAASLTSTGAGNDISLTESSDFGTISLASGRDAAVIDSNTLDLGASTIAGNLSVSAGGAISDSGAVVVSGTTSLTAGPLATPADISLNQVGTDFGGAVSVLRGQDVTLVDATAMTLAASTVSGNLNVVAGGNVTETGVLTVAGTSSFTAGDGDSVLLNSNAHSLAGAVQFAATAGTLSDVAVPNSVALNLGSTAVRGNLSASGAGVSDSGTLTVGGTASFTSTGIGNGIVLDELASDFGTLVLSSAGDASVVDANAVALGASSIGGHLSVNAGGAITESGSLSVTGNATFVASNGSSILLSTNTHTLTGTVAFGASSGTLANVSITDSTAIDLTALELTGDLTVDALSITNSGALDIAGTSSFTANAGASIFLNAVGNDFTGSVSLAASGVGNLQDVSLTNANAVAIGPLTLNGALTVVAGGDITDSGDLVVAGASSFTAAMGSSVLLDSSGNQFDGTLDFAATTGSLDRVQVTDTTAVDLASLSIAGDLTVVSGGTITDSGALSIGGNSSFTGAAGESVLLDDIGNVFSGSVQFAASSGTLLNVTLVDTTAVDLLASTVGGDLVVVAGGTGITDSGAISVAGTITLTANTGASIVLDSLNTFSGAVSFQAAGVGNLANVTIVDTTGMDLQSLTLDGDLSVTADGDVTDSGNVVVAGNSS